MPSSRASEHESAQESAPLADNGDPREAEIVELRERVAQLDDRHKRALADLDNYRKRSVQLTANRIDEAADAMLREWLEAVDSVERALRMENGSPMSEGLRGLLDQMEAILERHGVERIGAPGEPFDPSRHEAVAVHPAGNVPDRTIVDVARSGWARGDRVLRPAQVVVSRGAD
jgi:molecular chaperone GrpE